MATFTILVKIYSIEHFCTTKIPGLGEIFVQQKFSTILGGSIIAEIACYYQVGVR